MPQQLSSSLESSLRTEHLEGFILSHLRPPFFTLLEGQKKLKRQRIKEDLGTSNPEESNVLPPPSSAGLRSGNGESGLPP